MGETELLIFNPNSCLHFPPSREPVVSFLFVTFLPSACPQTELGQLQFLCHDLLFLLPEVRWNFPCLNLVAGSCLPLKSWTPSVPTCVKHTLLQTSSQCIKPNSGNALSHLLLAGGAQVCAWLGSRQVSGSLLRAALQSGVKLSPQAVFPHYVHSFLQHIQGCLHTLL